jgi:hypothetical protein
MAFALTVALVLAQATGDTNVPTSPSILFEPLRLGLMSDVPPLLATDRECSDERFATPRTAARALSLAPRLTLVGFSRAACPIESAIGGGLTYVVPLRPAVFFVASAGVLAQPPYGPRPLILHTQARADIVFDRGQGLSWSVGLRSNRGNSPSLSVGGIF